jgi:hypothetical protein
MLQEACSRRCARPGLRVSSNQLSPALEWSGVPEEAVELAVLCQDPDAPAAPSSTSRPEGGRSETADGQSADRSIAQRKSLGNSSLNPPINAVDARSERGHFCRSGRAPLDAGPL